MRLVYWHYREHETRNGLLLRPNTELGWIAGVTFVTKIDQKLRITLNYESATIPKIQLVISNKQVLEPTSVVTRSVATWTIIATSASLFSFDVFLSEPSNLAIRELTIEDIN